MNHSFSMKWLVLGAIFAVVYFLLAIGAAGAGHGTSLFFAPIIPYGLGLMFFPLIGFLAGNLHSFFTRALFLAALAAHYGLVLIFIKLIWVEFDDYQYFQKIWDQSPAAVILPAAFYVLGNLIVYAAFIISLQDRRNKITA